MVALAKELRTSMIRERVSNGIYFLRCVVYFLVRGPAYRAVQNPKTIVIVQFAKLGDIVCTTPMFRAVKEVSPDTRVVVVGNAVNKLVLEGNTDVDRYIVCGSNIKGALAALREENAEAGISVGPSIRAFVLLYLAGIKTIIAPRVIGGINSEGRLYLILRRLAILIPHAIGSYAPREYLRLLEPVGIEKSDTTKHLAYSEAAKQTVTGFIQRQQIIPGTLIVGIAPSAGNKLKNWPAERFAEVSRHMWQTYRATIVIVGGTQDVEEGNVLSAHLGTHVPHVNSSGIFSIDELKALIASLSLFISVDTGPIYIAEAFKVPTIDIVGPMDEHEQPPIGPLHVVIPPPYKRTPVLFVMSPGHYNYPEARRQVESITAERVIHAIDTLVPKILARVY